MLELLDITLRSGVTLRAIYVPAGDPGPLGSTDRRMSEPCVEFYDRTGRGTPHGRILGRYAVRGLLARYIPGAGWNPDTIVGIDSVASNLIVSWLRIAVARNPAVVDTSNQAVQ
jgi:hypothetical protein